MERVTMRQPIAEALELLPAGIRRRVEHADFLTGCDPAFVGLHREVSYADTGWRYSELAHVTWLVHQRHLPVSQRNTTVVLPKAYGVAVIIHELGHVLHEAIHCPRMPIYAVSAYARTCWYEAFAEAFEVWLTPPQWRDERQDRDVLLQDKQTLALFEELAR